MKNKDLKIGDFVYNVYRDYLLRWEITKITIKGKMMRLRLKGYGVFEDCEEFKEAFGHVDGHTLSGTIALVNSRQDAEHLQDMLVKADKMSAFEELFLKVMKSLSEEAKSHYVKARTIGENLSVLVDDKPVFINGTPCYNPWHNTPDGHIYHDYELEFIEERLQKKGGGE